MRHAQIRLGLFSFFLGPAEASRVAARGLKRSGGFGKLRLGFIGSLRKRGRIGPQKGGGALCQRGLPFLHGAKLGRGLVCKRGLFPAQGLGGLGSLVHLLLGGRMVRQGRRGGMVHRAAHPARHALAQLPREDARLGVEKRAAKPVCMGGLRVGPCRGGAIGRLCFFQGRAASGLGRLRPAKLGKVAPALAKPLLRGLERDPLGVGVLGLQADLLQAGKGVFNVGGFILCLLARCARLRKMRLGRLHLLGLFVALQHAGLQAGVVL